MTGKRDTYLLCKPCGCIHRIMATHKRPRKIVDAYARSHGLTVEVLPRKEAIKRFTERVDGCPNCDR